MYTVRGLYETQNLLKSYNRCLECYLASYSYYSQPHKHLQLIPVPLVSERPILPVETLINQSKQAKQLLQVQQVKELGYVVYM